MNTKQKRGNGKKLIAYENRNFSLSTCIGNLSQYDCRFYKSQFSWWKESIKTRQQWFQNKDIIWDSLENEKWDNSLDYNTSMQWYSTTLGQQIDMYNPPLASLLLPIAFWRTTISVLRNALPIILISTTFIIVKQKLFEIFQVLISSGFAWACCARWVSTLISVNQPLTHIAARSEINLKYCKRNASIIEQF